MTRENKHIGPLDAFEKLTSLIWRVIAGSTDPSAISTEGILARIQKEIDRHQH